MNYYVNPHSDLTRWTVKELRHFYANARTTDCQSIGHAKGNRNHQAAKLFQAELESRNAPVPNAEWVDDHGKFNGSGAS